jgi:membrane protein
MKNTIKKLIIAGKTFLQRLVITIHLYMGNGLANHAAACAYGFLLSMGPLLLLIAFILFIIFERSPGAITALMGNIPFLPEIFEENWFNYEIFSGRRLGISGVIGILSIIWAVRILALSIQRGLKIIFPAAKNRNPAMDILITLAIDGVLLVFVLMSVISSRTALRFITLFDFFSEISILNLITSHLGGHVFYVVLLGIFSFIFYLFVPLNSPRKTSAFQGAFFCVIAYSCTSMALDFILDISRYDFLYGALGNLIIMLINVFFFFNFFLMGAQFAFVIDSFKEFPASLMDVIKNKNLNIDKAISDYKSRIHNADGTVP